MLLESEDELLSALKKEKILLEARARGAQEAYSIERRNFYWQAFTGKGIYKNSRIKIRFKETVLSAQIVGLVDGYYEGEFCCMVEVRRRLKSGKYSSIKERILPVKYLEFIEPEIVA